MKYSKFTICVYFVVLLTCMTSCSEDNPVKNNNVGIVPGYNDDESSDCMTLACLAYVNENNNSYLRDSLKIQLAITSYATEGKWILDWGPALSPDQGNMMYVVKDTTTTPDRYAIAIRGTDWCFPINWKEDILGWDLQRYPYGDQPDSVAEGTLDGLNVLLSMTDSATNRNLAAYLNSLPTGSYVYITGHSLGGALATILSAWFMDNNFTSRLPLKSYTFAAPSIGNEFFVSHFNNKVTSTGSESHRVINPIDLVPRFWNELEYVLLAQIPTSIPLSVEIIMSSIIVYEQANDLNYKHVGTLHEIGSLTAQGCSYPSSFDTYECWVAFAHDHNNYLKLLNAPEVDFYYTNCKWKDPPQ
ncbi:MAG: hypothetical protein ABIY50_09855 [Ignavibacteria bacterium]